MNIDLQGKVCVVTAAGQGIGRSTAIAFADAGAEVIATDINQQALGDLLHDRIRTAVLDVTDSKAIRAFFAELDGVDVLFNCAGWVPAGTIADCSREEWDKAWLINVSSMFETIQAALPSMIARGGGSIINMSSAASSIKGVPNRFAYSVTKAAVIGLTKSVAADYVTQGIRCNAICPGTVETPSLSERITAQAEASQRTVEAVYSDFVARQPMGRVGKAEEIAALVTYLASDLAAFTTGTSQLIDGGWSN